MFILSVKCLDENGSYRGLVAISKDLDLIQDVVSSKNMSLQDLRDLLSTHQAFLNKKKHSS